MGLTHDITIIKQQYRELFPLAQKRLADLFETLKTEYRCAHCAQPPAQVDEPLHPGCGYLDWQKQSILTLEQDIGKQVLDSLERMRAAREVEGACHQCGVCCSLASSEFDYATLQHKAASGDWFAQQFTSVFLPYPTHADAEQVHPQLVRKIVTQTGGEVHFYHCPHLTPDNLCGLFNDPRRPQICADYPETPLILMYKNCGYQPWKNKMLPTTLLAHATLELCQYYANRILQAVKAIDQSAVCSREETQ